MEEEEKTLVGQEERVGKSSRRAIGGLNRRWSAKAGEAVSIDSRNGNCMRPDPCSFLAWTSETLAVGSGQIFCG